MNEAEDIQVRTRASGQVIFVLAGLVVTLLLLSQIGNQTVWSERARNIGSQPRLWPAIALLTMLAGFAAHFWRQKRRRPNRLDWLEARRWLEPLEYLLWFLAYVLAVPRLGFLPMSIVMACALTYRLGYRQRASLWIAAGFAVAMVALFKGFLGVNIPGAQLYNLLPGALRSFALTYL